MTLSGIKFGIFSGQLFFSVGVIQIQILGGFLIVVLLPVIKICDLLTAVRGSARQRRGRAFGHGGLSAGNIFPTLFCKNSTHSSVLLDSISNAIRPTSRSTSTVAERVRGYLQL